MGKTRDIIVRHLNPTNDLEGICFYDSLKPIEEVKEQSLVDFFTFFKKVSYIQAKNISYFRRIPKHLLRGGAAGAAVGALTGLFNQDYSLSECALSGAMICGSLDLSQYVLRGAHQWLYVHLFGESS